MYCPECGILAPHLCSGHSWAQWFTYEQSQLAAQSWRFDDVRQICHHRPTPVGWLKLVTIVYHLLYVFVPTSKTLSRTLACFWRFLCRCLRPADKLWHDWIVGTVFWPVSSAKFSSGTWWTPLTNMRLSSWRSSTARSWRAPPRRVWTLTTRMRRRSVLPQRISEPEIRVDSDDKSNQVRSRHMSRMADLFIMFIRIVKSKLATGDGIHLCYPLLWIWLVMLRGGNR